MNQFNQMMNQMKQMNQIHQMNINKNQKRNEIKNLYLHFKIKIKEEEIIFKIQCKSNQTIKEAICKFYCKYGNFSKNYYFFYNGEKIINDELKFDECGINNDDEIIVIEQNDVNQINEILKTNQNSSNSNKMSAPKGNKRNFNFSPPENQQNLIQLNFGSSSGLNLILTFNKNNTIRDALGKYCQILGLGLQKAKSLVFIYNAEIIPINDERFLADVFTNHSVITIVDANNVIGA